MKRILIIILLTLFNSYFISCQKKQEKDKDLVDLNNLVLLGVIKRDSLYTVNNRCDGGYPVLRFYKNEFYFYVPQEGINYLIESIEEIKNNEYKITTKGYYSISNQKPIKEKRVWRLIKENELLWNFEDDKLNVKYQFADTISLIKRKISFYNQPCIECWDDEMCNDLKSKEKTTQSNRENFTNQKVSELVKSDFILNELPKLKKINEDIGGVDVLETYFGDVTNDKIEDIVLYYSLTAIGGNTNIDSGLFIYKFENGHIRLIDKIIPDFMFSMKKVFNNRIYIEKMEYVESDSRCCPSLKSEVELEVNRFSK